MFFNSALRGRSGAPKVAALLLLFLWGTASYRALVSEIKAVRSAPDILVMSYDEKRLMADGSVYELSRALSKKPPITANILFVSPFIGDRQSYYTSKLKYYLAPRSVKVVSSVTELTAVDIPAFDYIYYYLPDTGYLNSVDNVLREAAGFTVISSRVVQDGFLGVYGRAGGSASNEEGAEVNRGVAVTLLALSFAVALFVVSGLAIIRLVERLGGEGRILPGLAARCAVAFLLGLGTVSLSMFFYSLANIAITRLSIAVPWAIFALVVHIYPSRSKARGTCEPVVYNGRMGNAWHAFFLAIILIQVAYVFFAAMLMPVTGWDAWAIWFLKAKAFYYNGGVTKGFLTQATYSHGHPDYPLLVPLSITWLYACMNEANDILGKLIYPIKFLALLLVFTHLLSRLISRSTALFFTALLSLIPIIIAHSGGLPEPIGGLYTGDYAGYADLALSIFFVSAAGFMYLYAVEGRTFDLLLAAIFLGLGAWTKNEGLVFALIGILIGAFLFAKKDRMDWRMISAITLALGVSIVPWFLFRQSLSLASDFLGSYNLTVFFANIGRLPDVFWAFVRTALLGTGLYGLTWHVYLLGVLLTVRRAFFSPVAVLNLFVVCQASAYMLIYVITPSDLAWHMGTSLDRVILHLVPLALFVSAINFDAIFGKREIC